MRTHYDDLNNIPLGNFVDCYVDGKLESLIIGQSGVSREILTAAWEKIREQWIMAMGTAEQRSFILLLKEVNILAATINQATRICNVMDEAYHPSLGKLVNQILKCTIQWPEKDREIINRCISTARSRIKPVDMHFTMKKQVLARMEERLKARGDDKPTRSYFDLMLNLVEEHFSVPIDYNIVTSRFCNKVRRMDDQLRKRKSKK